MYFLSVASLLRINNERIRVSHIEYDCSLYIKLPACMCVHQACYLQGPERMSDSLELEVTDGCEMSCGC